MSETFELILSFLIGLSALILLMWLIRLKKKTAIGVALVSVMSLCATLLLEEMAVLQAETSNLSAFGSGLLGVGGIILAFI